MEKQVAVLFARNDSIYKEFDICDVYDIDRDARNFTGGLPIVAHPPCRAWGRLRGFAKPLPGEKELALFAVDMIRKWGGVLEHPETSKLWDAKALPLGREIDEYGGLTISVDQFWWGHRARKRTWLYIVGCPPAEVPAIPLRFDAITHAVSSAMRRGRKYFKPKPAISKAEREQTPPAFAEWLVCLAIKCSKSHDYANTYPIVHHSNDGDTIRQPHAG